jgi:signal transduction histidine kinase/DNA-binding response OmpR family regulator
MALLPVQLFMALNAGQPLIHPMAYRQQVKYTPIMKRFKALFQIDPDSRELLEGTARRLVYTVLAIHLAFHFTATLVWPRVFSPSLWVTTFFIITLTVISLLLMRPYYLVSQVVWLGGLGVIILHAYFVYKQAEILTLLVFLPLMATGTLRQAEAFIVNAALLVFLVVAPYLDFLVIIPSGYRAALLLGTVFTTIFGWGLSSNLLSAISASNYHYRQARSLLDETRQHRGQISHMLKEKDQANYQLERLNQMLHQARKRADEARGDRDRFILAVSHELRSPLNFILGFSDLMVNSPEVYAPHLEWPPGLYGDVQEIYRSSTHLMGLINDILDMGQIDARQMALFRETVGFEQIVEEVRRMVEPSFTHKGLWLRTELEAELPLVYVDCTRMRQVLLNLLNNSLRFTEHGGALIRVAREGDDVLVTVEDTGSGIAPEDIPKVFDEFRQVGQENWRRREGTGLGLSISRRFVGLHGGSMWLESKLEQGTRITFSIPAQKTQLAPGVSAPRTGFQILDAQVREEQLVLLLTSDPYTSRLARQCLVDFRVIEVDKPDQLREKITQFYPRAVIVSHALVDVTRPFLKEISYELPVLVLALPTIEDRLSSLPDGIANYLVKPVSRVDLNEALSALPIPVHSLLIVDDDPSMLRFVTQALRMDNAEGANHDYRFLTAASGEEALRILADERVDVVLLDLDLPALSGWDVLDVMKENSSRLPPPVIVVSAHDMPPSLNPEGQELLNVWMKRSFTPHELGSILKTLLETLQPTYRFPISPRKND